MNRRAAGINEMSRLDIQTIHSHVLKKSMTKTNNGGDEYGPETFPSAFPIGSEVSTNIAFSQS